MHYVYVLWSKSKRQFYIGSANDLRKRFVQHNKGYSVATKLGRPWSLLYYEAYSNESLARQREQILKQKGKVWQSLRRRIMPDSA